MRFHEGCAVIRIEWWINTNRRIEYIRRLFEISHKTPTYIAITSSVIPTRIKGVIRRFAIAPGSAIICKSDFYSDFEDYIELSEPTWIDAKILIPYVRRNPCNKNEKLSIPISLDNEIGIENYCLEDLEKSELVEQSLRNIIQGGLVDVAQYEKEIQDTLMIALKFNEFFMFWKAMNIKKAITKSRIAKLRITKMLEVFSEPLAKIGNLDIVLLVGQGYVILFDPLDDVSSTLYSTVVLLSHLLPYESPRAKRFLQKYFS